MDVDLEETAQPNGISSLPDEILCRIFDQFDSATEKSHILTLTQVCQLWRSYAIPQLYHQLSLNFGSYQRQNVSSMALRNILRRKPHIASYVQELELDIRSKADVLDLCEASDILKIASPTLKKLTVLIGDDHTGLVAQIVASRVRHLVLKMCKCPPLINMLLHWGENNSAHRLEIHDGGRCRGCPLNSFEAIRGQEQSEILIPSVPCNLEYLHISDNRWPLEALQRLIAWPKALKSLSFDVKWTEDPLVLHSNVKSLVQSLYDTQKDSLENIVLSEFFRIRDALDKKIDLSGFYELRRLRIYGLDFFSYDPEEASSKFSCPKLELIEIDQSYDYSRTIIRTWPRGLDKQEVSWLIKFLTRRRDTTGSDSKLKEIHLRYPWDYVDWFKDQTDVIQHHRKVKSQFEDAACRLEKLKLGVRLTWPVFPTNLSNGAS